MSKKLITLFSSLLIAALIISGCGSDDKESKGETANASEEKDSEQKEKDSKKEEDANKEEDQDAVPEEEGTEADSSNDFSELIAYMEEETEGTTKILYENDEPQVHKMDGISVSLDAHKLVELNDFHTDFEIPFNDQTDGGVIIAKYTVTNELDKDVYYMPSFYMSFTGAQKAYNNDKYLLPEEAQLPTKLAPSSDYLLKAGESVTGYYTYPLGKDVLDKVLDLSTVAVEIPSAQAEKGEFSSPIGKDGKITISLNEEGAEKIASNEAFYNDKVTSEDMGEKKMLKEKKSIDESKKLGDVTVHLDGYQFTAFTPNSEEAPRFENFGNGIVLLTVKFKMDNKGPEDIGLAFMNSKLTVNDGAQYMLQEGMLLDYRNEDLILSGESGELLQIYVLDQEQYEKIWRDKPFEVEIGPIKNKDVKDISKGKKAAFTLPN